MMPPPPQMAAPAASRSAVNLREEEERAKERRRRENIDQAAKRDKMAQLEKMKCHLHKKPKDNCKFCRKHKDLAEELERNTNSENSAGKEKKEGKRRKIDRAISEEGAEGTGRPGPVELANVKSFGFAG